MKARPAIFFIACIVISGCAGVSRYATNYDLILRSVHKAAETVSSTVSQQIDKKKKVVLHDLNEEYIETAQAKLSMIIEDNLISGLVKNGFTVTEKNVNILWKRGDKFPQPDYIIAYRLLKCGVEYEDGSVPKSVRRNAVTRLNVRIVDAKTGNIIWAGETDEIVTDEVDSRAVRYLKMPDMSFDGYDSIPVPAGEDITFEDNIASDETEIGLSNWILAGVGYSRWSSPNIIFEGGLGYKVSPEISAGLNVGYFPYSIKSKGGDKEFNGQVFPVYFSAESCLFSCWKMDSNITAGFGMYVYVGDVDVPDDPDASKSGSGVTVGVNSGLSFRIQLKNNFNFDLSAKYHYTGYEFGSDFQFITGGINYQF